MVRAMPISEITREKLHAYLNDALTDPEMAQVEQALRDSEALRRSLQKVMQDRERGEHTLGAVWCRERLTCPSREQLGSFLLQVLDDEQQEYIEFHLQAIGCAFCLANLADLKSLQNEPAPNARERRRRFFQSSAGYLHIARDGK
jgi:DNA-binding phage protein